MHGFAEFDRSPWPAPGYKWFVKELAAGILSKANHIPRRERCAHQRQTERLKIRVGVPNRIRMLVDNRTRAHDRRLNGI